MPDMVSAGYSLFIVPAVLAFGTFLIARGRLVLSKGGYVVTAATLILGLLDVISSIMTIAEIDRRRAIEVISKPSALIMLAWFSALAFWPKLVAKGVRSQHPFP